jgi:alpha-glucosidase (family GH31 glycosyl hydrolase)
MVMWNTDNSYGVNTDPLYQSHPYYLGLRKGIAYGIFQDNSYRSELMLERLSRASSNISRGRRIELLFHLRSFSKAGACRLWAGW